MEYTTLGNTGLRVSVAGLGCGGDSRLGRSTGKSEVESVAIVRRAIDLGVNFLDTAAAYGTETVVGAAVKDVPRHSIVISTKALTTRAGEDLAAGEMVESLDQSLRRLGTDYVDVFHMHGVVPASYDHVVNAIVPAMLREKEKGKFRHLGITEAAAKDSREITLQRAVHDDCWEVMMLAFHMMNQKARVNLFPHTIKKGIGTLIMFAVRKIFSVPGRLEATMEQLARERRVPAWLAETGNPLGFLIHDDGASSVIDAAYRFARHESGADVVLFGTGDPNHLKANVESILKPPLPRRDTDRLYGLFGALEGVGLDPPTVL